MCPFRQPKLYSRMFHALLSAYGSRWNDRYLGMFTTYIDDSGSAPEHKMAIASGIILAACRLEQFESEWNTFLVKEGIAEFHASECLARNPRSEFANWDDERVTRVFARVRQITFKYFVKAFSIGIHKQDYNEVVTPEMKLAVGESHYVWAVSSVLGLAHDWAISRNAPMEYVFDTAEKKVKREVDDVLAFVDVAFPGHFIGHYAFRNRREVPALQAVDLLAWTCFQGFNASRFGRIPHPIADASIHGYLSTKGPEWRVIQSLNREGLEKWVNDNKNNPRTQEIIEFRQRQKEARRPKLKPKGNN